MNTLAQELSYQFAGASIAFWISFHVIVAVLLFIDLVILPRLKHNVVKMAWAWTGVLAACAFCFALLVSHQQGHEPAVEFVAGYLVEGSLSVDNLFVFLLLFRSLKLDTEDQRRVLLWGVLGAIVMRAICIFAGVALLNRFHWVQYCFGAILLYAGIRLLRSHHDQGEAEQPGPIRWLRQKVGAPSDAAIPAKAFLLIVLAVEATDLLFALDSIPAVLAITRDTFVVYTSNIFAILGLRSLYFALADVLGRLRLLHYGLAVILIFVAAKMLLSHWLEVPAWISLLVILGVLGIFAAASYWADAKDRTLQS